MNAGNFDLAEGLVSSRYIKQVYVWLVCGACVEVIMSVKEKYIVRPVRLLTLSVALAIHADLGLCTQAVAARRKRENLVTTLLSFSRSSLTIIALACPHFTDPSFRQARAHLLPIDRKAPHPERDGLQYLPS